ncbi:peptidase [Vibrio parahaemolyticus]|nr:peptidase [Vibrio parahaemolyticus]
MTTTALTALCFNMSDIQQVEGGVWLPLIPKGVFTGIDGRTWNNSQPELVVARFNKKRPFDVEHSTHIKAPKGEPAPAYGWILKVENRDGEIWGYTEWNEDGQKLIDGKSYAFYSPAFGALKDGTVTAIASSGLTNDPNLDVPALNHKEESEMTLSQLLRDALGLGEDATEQQAVTAINTLQSEKEVALNRANTPDLNLFVPKDTYEVALNRATTAEAELAEINQQKVEALVQSAIDDGKVAPADKDMYVGLCSSEKGREQFAKFIEGAPQIATNRQVETPKDKDGKPKLEEHEVALCRKMGVTEEEFLAAKQTMNVGAK